MRTAATRIPLRRVRVTRRGCWIWKGAHHTFGYGYIWVKVRNKPAQRVYLPRLMYQIFVEPLNNRRQPDHLCRNAACFNPMHLEAVTSYINSVRGMHPLFVAHRKQQCTRGHDMRVEENVTHRKDGRPRCLICIRNRRKSRARHNTP